MKYAAAVCLRWFWASSVLIGLALAAPLATADAVIKKNHMKHNNVRYYVAGTQLGGLNLGSWGNKKTPALQANRLEVLGSFKSQIGPVQVTHFGMTQNGSTFANFVGHFEVPLMFGLSGNDLFAKMNSREYLFVEISIKNKNQGFRSNINRHQKGKIRQLRMLDKPRVVTSIIVVMAGSEAQTLLGSHQSTGNAMFNAGKVEFASNVASTQTRTYTPSAGSVYAYMLDDMTWDKRAKKKRTKIISFSNDQHGPY